MAKAFLVLLLSALAAYAAILALMWWKQESLLFFPVPLPAHHRLAQEPDVHERTVRVDGAELSVLHLKLPEPRGVVFFLHGNAGNLAGWFVNTAFYRQANFDLVMPDYRGFGKSTGRIASPRQLRDDVRAVWDAIAPAYAGKRIVVYGRSLGSGLAAELAADLTREQRPPALTVLVSPYTSIRALTSEFYPWVPGALLRYPLDTAAHLPHVGGDLLLVHAERDTLVGAHHPRALQALVPRARLLVVPRAGHNDLQDAAVYREELRRALARL